MLWLLFGLACGVALSLPLIPLLRVTEPVLGRAAAGIALIGVALFAIRFWTVAGEADEVPGRELAMLFYDTTLNVGPAFVVAAVIAALGVSGWRRA